MFIMLAWLAARMIRLVRLRHSRINSYRTLEGMERRQLQDIGLACADAPSRHLHFANAEAQLGMIR